MVIRHHATLRLLARRNRARRSRNQKKRTRIATISTLVNAIFLY